MRRPVAGTRVRVSVVAAVLALLAVSVTACAGGDTIERTGARPTSSGSPTAGTPSASASSGSPGDEDPSAYAVADPGHLKTPLFTPDLLLTSSKPIPDAVRSAVTKVRGVRAVMPLSLASLSANGRTLTIAAADPAKFRRFTAYASARSDEVWKRVAGGEVAVDPGLPKRLEEPAGYLRLGSSDDAPQVHIGAYAPLVKQISAVVDYKRGEQLGLPHDNALLVSTGTFTPSAVTPRLKKVIGSGLTMQTLALEFDTQVQTAVLSGSSVSSRVGTFTYSPHPDGTITPDRGWVSTYIRTEPVPILGSVTCNKGMVPQLRAALTEVVDRGLADKIHPGEYAGCYYPRFIAGTTTLSNHSFGLALDLNVPGNQRGTVGEMDRGVVSIFKEWGFAWGGDWSYTDPMHFEMAQLVEPR